MPLTDVRKRERLPVDRSAETGERGREQPGWKGLLLGAAAILGEELLRRWLRSGRRGEGGKGMGRGRGRRS